MAKGFKSGGKNFEKGHKPLGHKLPADIRKAKEITQQEFVRDTCELLRSTKDELQSVLKNPETPAMKLMIGGIIAKAITEQDIIRAEFLLNRIIGRVGFNTTLNVNDGRETPTINFGLTKADPLPDPNTIDV